jgi:DNA polymerase I-like protein with 3'-5' exonuclease and polymerase domains
MLLYTTNQKLAGLKSRDQAKTFIYALIYGAGDAKLGTVVEGGRREGETLRRSFLNNLPSFKSFKDRIKREAANGWVRGLDGRKILVRSEHSALNTKLQGAGAIVMKVALIILNEKLKGLDASFVANVHDEWQIEAHQDIADKVGNLGVKSIEEAGNYLGLKCPLTGEYNVGNNWAETH